MECKTYRVKKAILIIVLFLNAAVVSSVILRAVQQRAPELSEVDFAGLEMAFDGARITDREIMVNYSIRQSGWTAYIVNIDNRSRFSDSWNFGIVTSKDGERIPIVVINKRYMLIKPRGGEIWGAGHRRVWKAKGWELLDPRR